MKGIPAASSTFAWDFTSGGTFGLFWMPVRNEVVSTAVMVEPASAVPMDEPSWDEVFCRPPTSEAFSSGTADTVAAPS